MHEECSLSPLKCVHEKKKKKKRLKMQTQEMPDPNASLNSVIKRHYKRTVFCNASHSPIKHHIQQQQQQQNPIFYIIL